MRREDLPGQLRLPFGKKKKRRPPRPPVEPRECHAYRVVAADGTEYIQLWSTSSTVDAVREHFATIHPEHSEFAVGVLGVGEYIVDRVLHGWVPDERMVDQDGNLVEG